MYVFGLCSGLCAKEENRLKRLKGGTSVEKKNTAKLIRHKRRQRDKLIVLLIWGLIGAALSVGFMLTVLLYCRMAGPLI